MSSTLGNDRGTGSSRFLSGLRRSVTFMFVLLALGALASGGIGFHAVTHVVSTVRLLVDVTSPMTQELERLKDTAYRLRLRTMQAVHDAADAGLPAREIDAFDEVPAAGFGTLKSLAAKARLELSFHEAEEAEDAFLAGLRDMAEARREAGIHAVNLAAQREKVSAILANAWRRVPQMEDTDRTFPERARDQIAQNIEAGRATPPGMIALLKHSLDTAIDIRARSDRLMRALARMGDAAAGATTAEGRASRDAAEARTAWREAQRQADDLIRLTRNLPQHGWVADLQGDVASLGVSMLGGSGLFAQARLLGEARAELAHRQSALVERQARYFTHLDQIAEAVRSLNHDARGEASSAIDEALLYVGLTVAGYLVFAAFVGLAVSKQITKPIWRLTQHATRISLGGNLLRMDDAFLTTRMDEIGALTRAFNSMLAELAYARRKLVEQSEAEVRVQYDRLNAAVSSMPHGLVMFDRNRRVVICNDRFGELYGLDPKHLLSGTHLEDMLEASVAAGIMHGSPERRRNLFEAIDVREERQYITELADGRVIAIAHKPTRDGGSLSVHEDVTERQRQEARIAFLAMHDMLTGLPNRVAFREALTQGVSRAARGHRVAVICFDLDHFKAVNDTLGHPIGDALLMEVARRVGACLRTTDTLARLGGDEFAIVQLDIDQASSAAALAERLIGEVGRPYEIDGHNVLIGASVGIAIAPDDGLDPDDLLRQADMALYRSKEMGRGVHSFFEPGMNARMQERHALETDLRQALSARQFEVFYQPLVRAETGQIGGFEALLRWRHPERGLISPADFLPIVEEIGMIGDLGRWVLTEACMAAASWPEGLRIAVNLSPLQFASHRLVDDVDEALRRTGLAPARLELEITEATLMNDAGATIPTLGRLRDLGVRIAMDDFGTGCSSLGYLRMFPFDKIKIDRSFMRDTESLESVAIVRAVSRLAETLGIATVAEGIETEEQLVRAQAESYQEVQGYLFSEPVPLREVAALLERISSRARPAATSPSRVLPAPGRSGAGRNGDDPSSRSVRR